MLVVNVLCKTRWTVHGNHRKDSTLGNSKLIISLKLLRSTTSKFIFEATDFATTAITSRFDQKDFQESMNIQELLLKTTAKEVYDAELAEVLKVFGKV